MSYYKAYVHRLLTETGCFSIPVDLEAIAASKNILIKEDDSEGYTGMLLVVNDMALISVQSSIRENTRKRFTIAHEMGHLTLPGHLTKDTNMFQCSDSDMNAFGKDKTKEVEANLFAAELLMPEDEFRKRVSLVEPSKNLIYELSNEFGTSLTATCIRLVNFKPEYALVCSSKSRVKWFYRGEDFPYYLGAERGGPLHPSSYASVYFKTGRPAEEFYNVPTEAWIDDRRVKDSHQLTEMALELPGYDQVLSLLYLDGYDEEEQDDDDRNELTGYPRFR